MVFVDLRDKRIFSQHRFVVFPQPRGKFLLKFLFEEVIGIAEICRAEHRHRNIDPFAPLGFYSQLLLL